MLILLCTGALKWTSYRVVPPDIRQREFNSCTSMAYFGMVIPPWVGHLNPATTLGRELQRRGHRVAVISFADAAQRVQRAGLEHIVIGQTPFPAGEWERLTRQLAVRTGLSAGKFTIDWIGRMTRTLFTDLPPLLREKRFDGLIMDQICFGTESVADSAGVPFVVACNALPVHMQPDIPPHSETWPWSPSPWARLRIRAVQHLILTLARAFWVSIRDAEVAKGRRWNVWHQLNEIPPSLAQVSQLPACFDFPRQHSPDHFHHTGPWHEPHSGGNGEFDWSWRDSRPLIYASLGTLQNGLDHLYQLILDACADLPVQLVLTLGRDDGRMPVRIPPNARVLGYGPQLALIQRASLVITHAGMNTALEALAQGLPLLALPITNDQPGIAARIKHTGVGEWLPLRRLTPQKLRTRIEHVMREPSYRLRAQACATELGKMNGLARAADIVEDALLNRRRVLRNQQERAAPTLRV